MSFVELRPRICEETSKLIFPTRDEYIKTYKEVLQTSMMRRYFGCYYSGMTELGTGNWAVVADDENSEQVAFISLEDLCKAAQEVDYNGYVWFSLDSP